MALLGQASSGRPASSSTVLRPKGEVTSAREPQKPDSRTLTQRLPQVPRWGQGYSQEPKCCVAQQGQRPTTPGQGWVEGSPTAPSDPDLCLIVRILEKGAWGRLS